MVAAALTGAVASCGGDTTDPSSAGNLSDASPGDAAPESSGDGGPAATAIEYLVLAADPLMASAGRWRDYRAAGGAGSSRTIRCARRSTRRSGCS